MASITYNLTNETFECTRAIKCTSGCYVKIYNNEECICFNDIDKSKTIDELFTLNDLTWEEEQEGFAGGTGATTTTGGAVGVNAYSGDGFAGGANSRVSYRYTSYDGEKTEDGYGGAIGCDTSTFNGGAVGLDAHSLIGFAGGMEARACEWDRYGFNKESGTGGSIGSNSRTVSGGSVGQEASSNTGGAIGLRAKVKSVENITEHMYLHGMTKVSDSSYKFISDYNNCRIEKIILYYGEGDTAGSIETYNDSYNQLSVERFFYNSTEIPRDGKSSLYEYNVTWFSVNLTELDIYDMDVIFSFDSGGAGGAVGEEAEAYNGFAGGYNAKALADDAVQLGNGTNKTPNTLQFRYTQIVNENGEINSSNLDIKPFSFKRRLTNEDDFNTLLEPGMYYYWTNILPLNCPITNAGIVEVIATGESDNRAIQRITRYGMAGESIERAYYNGKWLEWCIRPLFLQKVQTGIVGSTINKNCNMLLDINSNVYTIYSVRAEIITENVEGPCMAIPYISSNYNKWGVHITNTAGTTLQEGLEVKVTYFYSSIMTINSST